MIAHHIYACCNCHGCKIILLITYFYDYSVNFRTPSLGNFCLYCIMCKVKNLYQWIKSQYKCIIQESSIKHAIMYVPSSYCALLYTSICHVFYNGWMMKYMYIIENAREKIHVQNIMVVCVLEVIAKLIHQTPHWSKRGVAL